jgi:hypothetical protein
MPDADFNGDGRDDILWYNTTAGIVENWLGQPDGGFISRASDPHEPGAFVGTGHFNYDGRTDTLWADPNGGLYVSLTAPDGDFFFMWAAGFVRALEAGWRVSAIGDFNGDGLDDLLLRHGGGAIAEWITGQTSNWVSFIDNPQAANNSIPSNWQITAVGDFNRDGRDDLAWRRDDGAFTTWLAQPLGGFISNDVNAWNDSIPTSWQVVGTGDFNGDRRDDLIWRRSDGAFTSWLALSTGGFVSNDANAWADVPIEWQVVGTGDYNNDGIDDVLWRRSDGALTNWLGQHGRSFVSNDASALTAFSKSWFVLGAGDFNGDGRADLLWDNEDTGSRTTWLGDPDGGFAPTNRTDPLNAPHYILGLGDFNGDGRDDMLWRTPATGQVGIYVANPDGSFTLASSAGNPTATFDWQVAAVGDFDADGRDDLIWRHTDGTLINWLAQPNGGFAINYDATWPGHIPTSWQIVGTGDFDGNGLDDLIWRRDDGAFTSWYVYVDQPAWWNDGILLMTFVSNDARAWQDIPTSWSVAGTGDFNGDGRDDIIWRRNDGAFTEWLGQPFVTFESNDANAWEMVPLHWSIADTGDVNGDGRHDIIWIDYASGQLTTWLGMASGGFISNDANAWSSRTNEWVVLEHPAGSDYLNYMSGAGQWDY